MLTYEKWLNCVFDKSVNQALSSSRLDELDADTTFKFFYTTLVHSGSELLRFSDKQVYNGLYSMFGEGANIVYALKEPSISAQARQQLFVPSRFSTLIVLKSERDLF